ncbi:MAG: adenine nucleotide alpha hydrolase family protein [Actinobacteria bacterium]|nr:adenine nucleotide alpha hydrolase family protein [Actinomycetota bacterium]
MCRDQVAKAVEQFGMIAPGERVLVAVSGGKDSLAVWDLLVDAGYDADGLYLGLGIGDYSDESGAYVRRYAKARGLTLTEVDLPDDYGYDIQTGSRAARRAPCSACGLSKRHLFDKAAIDGGYDVVVTGHNLDDEAAVLFGNVLRWQTGYLGRQLPVLPARHGFPRKVKPLVRLSERETAAYCVLKGIDYIVDECPMAKGNRHLGYKEALNAIEATSPGTKFDFYFGFLARASAAFQAEAEAEQEGLRPCRSCGAPTPGEICAFCRLVERAGGTLPPGEEPPAAGAVPVTLGARLPSPDAVSP